MISKFNCRKYAQTVYTKFAEFNLLLSWFSCSCIGKVSRTRGYQIWRNHRKEVLCCSKYVTAILFSNLRFVFCLRYITWMLARQVVTCAWDFSPKRAGYQPDVFKMFWVEYSLFSFVLSWRTPLITHCLRCTIRTKWYTNKRPGRVLWTPNE